MEPHRTLNRRAFLSAGLVGLTRKAGRTVEGGFAEDGMTAGHALRDRTARARPQREVRTPVVIVGGGIAGLSAAWQLDRRGFRDFVLLEMNSQAGGNARWGENDVSAYPWAAHYVPVPNKESVLVRELMEEFGAVRDGQWEERYLCFSPQERLFIHGRWQEGIEPELAATAHDREQFRRFSELMGAERATGRYKIPLELGAAADQGLVKSSMSAWLDARGFDSPYLRWYVDYACRDDYGARATDTSAWAGIHYFASREHEEKGPLTWPEGNGWITRRLLAKLGKYVRTASPVSRIEAAGRRWRVITPQATWLAAHVIFAAPTFLARYLIEGAPPPVYEYSPWVTANVTLDRMPAEKGFPLAWDNVVYTSNSLGYVVATHQTLRSRTDRSVWTWYAALAGLSPAAGRKLLQSKPWDYWRDQVLVDLGRAHPDIRECVQRIDVMRLGHAMARPGVGRVPGASPSRNQQGLKNLWFANSDLSGVSIFEQAQANGVRAADQVLRAVSKS